MIRNELYYKNRINLLSHRDRENGKIVKKLERKIRKLVDKT